MTEGVDPMQVAVDELGGAMVPTPDDLLDDIGPMGCLWYLTQVAAFTLGRWAGTLDPDVVPDMTDDDGPVRALQAITLATGNLNAACIAVSILPEEAALPDAQA